MWLPRFATERARRRNRPDRPFGLVEARGGQLLLHAVDKKAERAGIRVGQTLADARAILPEIDAAEVDPAAEARALARLAEWCGRYTPWTAPGGFGNAGDGSVWLDVTGCARLFGGEPALLRDLARKVGDLGFSARAAAADTPGAAWAVARYSRSRVECVPRGRGRDALAPLPVAALRLTQPAVLDLHALGLRRVDDLLAMPRTALADRFGREIVDRLDQALGARPEPISPVAPASRTFARVGFSEPVGRSEDIAEALRDLASEIAAALKAEARGARRLVLVLHHSDGAVDRLAAGTSWPSCDAGHLARLFAERRIESAFGVDAMTLAVAESERLQPQQAAFGRGGQEADIAELADRLSARLGADRVLRPSPRESRIPERAVGLSPVTAMRPPPTDSWRAGILPPRLFSPPEEIEAAAGLDDPPTTFRWRGRAFRIERADGPERLSPEWWRPDDRNAVRDYYRVEDGNGRRFWIYREGRSGWRLHGIFGRSAARAERKPAPPERRKRPSAPPRQSARPPPYAELAVTTNFSFLRGASHPEELVAKAAALGLSAIAVSDRNTLAGAVRAHEAAKEAGIQLVVGARLDFEDAPPLLCFPSDRAAYGRLSKLITLGRRRAPKGACAIRLEDLAAHAAGQSLVAMPPDDPDDPQIPGYLARLREMPETGVWAAARFRYGGDDAARLRKIARLAAQAGVPMVAINDVCMHVPERKSLLDALACIREGCTIREAGFRLEPNAERCLKPPEEMARLFRDYPDAVRQTMEIAGRCAFSLDELRHDYPTEAPSGASPQAELERLAWEGAAERYPDGVPDDVKAQVARELELIGDLGYAPYFLTVHDTVRFARSRSILCQGRGSAANSAVCYCLGITAIDPVRMDLLFERFVSSARREPPDIDVDFEHERREEVIQYVYGKYGRDRAALAATVIHYRSRMAVREVGKAMGLSEDAAAAISAAVRGWSGNGMSPERAAEAGFDPDDPQLRATLRLAGELTGFPRHLSQHPGGFVVTQGPLSELVPVANAAMPGRTAIEWDKNDLDALGILKVDVLGLGMLTCIRKGLDLLARHYGRKLELHRIPADDPAVYDMLSAADSVGVFQVESRAQMTMLPRLRPRNFYDLVIEVAIVRPGPIQGDMVHPYLRRRNGEEPVDYPSPELRTVLEKTMGVPLFQEQAMRIAIVAAGFTPLEADKLRRAMATFRNAGTLDAFREKLVGGMIDNGYDREFAERCFRQIEGFGEYGFPESHAASFALLVYASAWLKKHYPDTFAAAILNSQPMGFYRPAQLVRDARAHGVEVHPVDVNRSLWDNALERNGNACALRLGLRQVRGFSQEHATVLAREAAIRPFASPADLQRRTGLPAPALERLAHADAFGSMGIGRRQGLWAAAAPAPLPLFRSDEARQIPKLPSMAEGEAVARDYEFLGLSLKTHPLALLRAELGDALPAERLAEMKNGARVAVAGLALMRQRPGTASGVVFMTIEDETGVANLVVWPKIFEKYRRVAMGARLIRTSGRLQREGIVIHVVADRMEDLTDRLRALAFGNGASPERNPGAPARLGKLYPSRDFR